ncbi:MAG: glycerophosphodiester phosphodiesterase [Ramlibacter sp.]
MRILPALLLAAVGFSAHAFDLQAHRGARALLPENSLPGFQFALETGVTTLELDIAITKDRVLVVSHDPLLNPDITRGPDGKFLEAKGPAIVNMTAAEVASYDVGRIKPGTAYAQQFADQNPVDGARIPTFAQLAELVKKQGNEQVRFAIETKVNPMRPEDTVGAEEFARLVIAAIRQHGLEKRASVLSFDWRTLQVVQREAPGIPTVYLTVQTANSNNVRPGSPWTAGFDVRDHGRSVPRMIKAAGGHTWSSFHTGLTADLVKEAQGLGLQVLAWTVNDTALMNRMLDMGVDGIVTDRPDLLRAEMEKRGLKLPPK